MKRDAEEEERIRIAEEQEKKRIEEERIRRIRDRAVPPFRDLGSKSQGPVKEGVDDLTNRLIREGLIVPRWNFEKEEPSNSKTVGEW